MRESNYVAEKACLPQHTMLDDGVVDTPMPLFKVCNVRGCLRLHSLPANVVVPRLQSDAVSTDSGQRVKQCPFTGSLARHDS